MSKYYLKVPIRKKSVEFSDDTYKLFGDVNNQKEFYKNIYLVDTNDPEAESGAREGKTIVGYIDLLNIAKESTNNYVDIYFKCNDDKSLILNFREGYTYTMKFKFSEYFYDVNGKLVSSNSCDGEILIPLKIVPEYQVWEPKDGSRNWNNDDNWRRAAASDFYAETDTSKPDYYYSNEENYKG